MIEIALTRDRVAIVNDGDAELASASWHARKLFRTWYAARNVRVADGRRVNEFLHRAVWARAHPGEPAPDEIDHENGDGLDCRRDNLRPASAAQNARNRRLFITNTSGFVGVTMLRDKPRSRPWRARVEADGHRRLAGYFGTAEEAALARDELARKLFGAFATYNFPQPGERSALCA